MVRGFKAPGCVRAMLGRTVRAGVRKLCKRGARRRNSGDGWWAAIFADSVVVKMGLKLSWVSVA